MLNRLLPASFLPKRFLNCFPRVQRKEVRHFSGAGLEKEAFIKAIGDGLAIPLNCFQVTLLPKVPARFVHIADKLGTASDWTLHHLEPAAGYVSAVAYQDKERLMTIHPTVQADELPEVLQAL